MNKNLTSNQLILLALVAIVLLIAALSFYLLQDPSAPLPFSPQATGTFSALPPTQVPGISPTASPIPTRQTSYTPFASVLNPSSSTPLPSPSLAQGSPMTPGATSTYTPTPPSTSMPSHTITPSPTSPAHTWTATMTETFALGEIGVTGRLLQNGTPVANVQVEFEDDVPPRRAATGQDGHYWFTTLAPGTSFSLTFYQTDNPQLTPVVDLAYLAWIEGSLPTGHSIIVLPDFELSIFLNDMLYEAQSPVDGAAFPASVISSSNPFPFLWTLYNQGGTYYVELGVYGSDQSIWTSDLTASTYMMWNGVLDDGTHITQGNYWWRVGVVRSLGNYAETIFTQPHDLYFTP